MIRATFTGAALFVCAASSQAQNPTPEPTPATPVAPATTAKPARPSTARRARPVRALPPDWRSADLLTIEGNLDAVRDMHLDLDMITPMPPMAPMDVRIPDMDMDMDMDMDFDLAPRAIEMDGLMDM